MHHERTFVRLSLLVATLGIAGTAMATKFILDDNATFSETSGKKITSSSPGGASIPAWGTMLIGDDGDYQAVTGLEMWEQQDRPCKARVWTRHINTGTEETGAKSTDDCNNPGSQKEIKFTQTDRYVHGIAVCPSSSNSTNRIKGVRLYGAELSNGRIALVDGFKELKRSNCNDSDWLPAKHCPSGKLASRVRFHFEKNSFVGVDLECRTPIVK